MKVILAMLILIAIVSGCVQETVSEDSSGSEMNAPSENGVNSENTTVQQKSAYLPFTQSAYDQALQDKELIFLEFYANWCPTCKAQAPILEEAFREVDADRIIGFRVNYNDSETDDAEKNLARAYGVTYQHTHVIINAKEEQLVKGIGQWSKEQILSAIQEAENT